MHVLIVHKSSNFELHGERVRNYNAAGGLAPENLRKLQVAHDQHYACLDFLRQQLQIAGITFDVVQRGHAWPEKAHDVVMTVGGDGTLLACSQQMLEYGKIVGIRSSEASVGHLCTGGYARVQDIVAKLAAHELPFVEVARLRARIVQVPQKREYLSVPVLNDILFANVNPAATTRYSILFAEERETHKSSGIWISTAAGSTAGIHAAGGTVLPFTDTRFQFKVRELYQPRGRHYKINGAVFDPETTTLKIENRSEHALIALDGQHRAIHLGFGDTVEILRAPAQQIARPDSLIERS